MFRDDTIARMSLAQFGKSSKLPAALPFVNAAGAGVSLALTIFISCSLIGGSMPTLLVASIGASAVLIFCAPEGAFSTHWAVLGGHVISALFGIFIANQGLESTLAAAIAVGGAIFLMQIANCVHPPGGATALSAIVASQSAPIDLHYLVSPVLLNVGVLWLCGLIFHHPGWLKLRVLRTLPLYFSFMRTQTRRAPRSGTGNLFQGRVSLTRFDGLLRATQNNFAANRLEIE